MTSSHNDSASQAETEAQAESTSADAEGDRNGQVDGDERERARVTALLEATHRFPCEFYLTVIALSGETIMQNLAAAVAQIDALGRPFRSQPSSGGKYTSHRFSVRVTAAQDVLQLYAVVKAVEGVVTVM